jgi:hypothetical protein
MGKIMNTVMAANSTFRCGWNMAIILFRSSISSSCCFAASSWRILARSLKMG